KPALLPVTLTVNDTAILKLHRASVTSTPAAIAAIIRGKRLVRTVLIFTESSDQLSRATDRVPGLPASPGYVQ
ncbi:hypothetical protein NI813_28165, partial [Escherichia coli]|nr:hypothetical protein [Escherichia coli]MCO7852966.1 hypothetical protein [Escherichia coli]MCO7868127.1 hypothetical protein [Escherichia coli]